MTTPSWTMVAAVDLGRDRRRLEYVFAGGEKRHGVVNRELDTPEMRQRIADALWAEEHRAKSPRGPVRRDGSRPSPWITS